MLIKSLFYYYYYFQILLKEIIFFYLINTMIKYEYNRISKIYIYIYFPFSHFLDKRFIKIIETIFVKSYFCKKKKERYK